MSRIIVVLSVVAVVFFAYTPFAFVLSSLSIAKESGFIAVSAIALFGAAIHFLTNKEIGNKKVLFTILLYAVCCKSQASIYTNIGSAGIFTTFHIACLLETTPYPA